MENIWVESQFLLVEGGMAAGGGWGGRGVGDSSEISNLVASTTTS